MWLSDGLKMHHFEHHLLLVMYRPTEYIVLQLTDCQRGIIIDGLETLFSQTMLTTARAILKAFNNRKYIYLLTLKHDYSMLKEQERKNNEEKGETFFDYLVFF